MLKTLITDSYNLNVVIMENKKSRSAQLGRFRFMFWNLGLIISLLMVISAFEYRFYDEGPVITFSDLPEESLLELEVDPTVHPPPKPVVRNPEIIEVEDDVLEEDEIDIKIDFEFGDIIGDVNDIMEDVPEEKPETIVNFAEIMPSPKGGLKAFYAFINDELRYPAVARRLGIEGTVYLVFVVDRNGNIGQIEVLMG